MGGVVESTIDKLKRRFGAKNEAELARYLMVGQSTISTWKSRDRVPDRIQRIADGEHPLALGTTPLNWGPHEQAALGLALTRYARLHSTSIKTSDFAGMMVMADRPGDLWTLFRRAQAELYDEMERSGGGLSHSPLAVLLHRDCDNPEEAERRDRDAVESGRPQVEWNY